MTQPQDPKADPRFDALRDDVRGERPRAASAWDHFTCGDGCKLFFEEWMPAAPCSRMVLCFHGMAAHSRYFALLADALTPHGIGVFAYDYRGHGLSDGPRGVIPDAARLVADARQIYAFVQSRHPGTPLFTFGESMGGAMNANLILSSPAGLRGAVFAAPAIAPAFRLPLAQMLLFPVYGLAALFAPGARIVKLTGQERQGMNNDLNVAYDQNDPLHLSYGCMRYLRNVKRLMDAARHKTPEALRGPTLVFQGGCDAAVSPQATRQFFDAVQATDKTLKFYDDAKHCMLTDPVHGPLLTGTLIDWLISH